MFESDQIYMNIFIARDSRILTTSTTTYCSTLRYLTSGRIRNFLPTRYG